MLAVPCPRANTASFSIGTRMRLTTKPGSSSLSTTCLPRLSAKARVRATVSGAVARPGITSISFITGTGLKKCKPMKRFGSDDPAAIRVIGMELVLLARMASGPSTLAASAKILALISSRSVAASMMMAASAKAA